MGAGPVTDTLGRPSQGVLENRTAAQIRQDRRSFKARSRKAVAAVHDAEMDLLVASQRATRRAAVSAIDAALSSQHAGAIAAIVARFSDRRSALLNLSDAEREAALRQLASDEAHELARLALAHASEKKALRMATLRSISVTDRVARRSLRLRNWRQRIIVSIQQQRFDRHDPSSSARKAQAAVRAIANRRTIPSG